MEKSQTESFSATGDPGIRDALSAKGDPQGGGAELGPRATDGELGTIRAPRDDVPRDDAPRDDVRPDDAIPRAQTAAAAAFGLVARSDRAVLPRATHARSPVVIELFTAQGCSNCPPADEMLADLAERPDVLTLSWHVDYWDYLGWRDDFASADFTARQKDYARASGERAIYTPQILVGGSDTLIALRPADLMALIHAHKTRPALVSLSSRPVEEGFQIDLTPRSAAKRGVAILLVRYAPSRRVEVRAGENRGLEITYHNIVLGAERVALWDGRAPLRLTVSRPVTGDATYPADTRHAILAQQLGRKGKPTGPIMAAIKLD